jgi:prophage regulatory protein
MATHNLETFLRKPDVLKLTGFKRTRLAEAVSAGEFPRPVKIGERAIAWRESEVASWQAQRIAARDAAPEAPPPKSKPAAGSVRKNYARA